MVAAEAAPAESERECVGRSQPWLKRARTLHRYLSVCVCECACVCVFACVCVCVFAKPFSAQTKRISTNHLSSVAALPLPLTSAHRRAVLSLAVCWVWQCVFSLARLGFSYSWAPAAEAERRSQRRLGVKNSETETIKLLNDRLHTPHRESEWTKQQAQRQREGERQSESGRRIT